MSAGQVPPRAGVRARSVQILSGWYRPAGRGGGHHIGQAAFVGDFGEQGAGVGEDEGVVVDVDDPGGRGGALGDFVGVVGRGQASADFQELVDALGRGQVGSHADQDGPGGDSDVDNLGQDRDDLVACLAAVRVIVLATEE